MSVRLGVIGAGAAAAAATYVLNEEHPGASVAVFEKSRGVCGRAAARRRDGVVYDYGANFLKDAGGRVSGLVTRHLDEGLVEVDGPIWTFDADGNVDEKSETDERRWTYEDGITRLAKHLFEAADVAVQRETRIADVRYEEGWRLTDSGGTEYGPFDVLLLNPPAPQTADLLRETGVGAVDRLGEAAAEVEYQTGWTAVLGYGFELEAPYYALANTDGEHEVGWIGREERKPGHVPGDQSVLIVQANSEWAAERYDASPEKNVADLTEHVAEITGDQRLADPAWTDHQRWGHALAMEGVEADVLQEAAEKGVYAAGDWVAGEGRLDAAVRSGLETGDALADSVR